VTVACTGQDESLTVLLPVQAAIEDARVRTLLRDLFNIYAGAVRVHRVPVFPQLANGKLDYRALEAMAATS
jgi:hypothetical protein